MGTVKFNEADISIGRVIKKKQLKAFINKVFKMEGKELDMLSYIFCTDNYLLDINKTFLQHDCFTDIITFDLSANEIINGEIYISFERVKENAFKFSSTVSQELLRVMFHGVLHLCG